MDVNLDVLRHLIGALVLENLSLKGQVESLRRLLSPPSPETQGLTSAPASPTSPGELLTSNPTAPPSAGS